MGKTKNKRVSWMDECNVTPSNRPVKDFIVKCVQKLYAKNPNEMCTV